MPLYRNRRFLGQDDFGPTIELSETGEPLYDRSGPTIVSAYRGMVLDEASINGYLENQIWPLLKLCASQYEIDDVMLNAYDSITSVHPLDSQTVEQSKLLSGWIDKYSQRAYVFLETGKDPWAPAAKTMGLFKIVAGIAAVVAVGSVVTGSWKWWKFWR